MEKYKANKYYQVKLKEITLKEAVSLMDKYTVFYTYEIETPLYPLTKDSLKASIEGNAFYLTPDSFVEIYN